MAGDMLFCPLTDSVPRHGNGYPHKGTVSDTRFSETLFGPRRVFHNFLNFTHWWTNYPEKADSFWKLMSSDGNGAWQNIIGHFVLSLIVTVVGCCILPKPLWIFCAGTFVNIFHEYVAEGCYVDPSFIDLWMDQTGLLLGMAVYLLFVRLKTRRVNKTVSLEKRSGEDNIQI